MARFGRRPAGGFRSPGRWDRVAVAPEQIFHRSDAAVITAGRAIDLGALARDVAAAAAFALAAAMALPERNELRTARPGVGAQRFLRDTLSKRRACSGRQHDSKDRQPSPGVTVITQLAAFRT